MARTRRVAGVWLARALGRRGRHAGGERGAPLQVLRRHRGRARRQLRGAEGRGVRAARAERRRQDHHGRDPRGIPRAERRPGADARRRPGRPQHAALASYAHRRRAPGAGGRAVLLGAPGADAQRRLLPQSAAGRRGDRADRTDARRRDDRVKRLSGGQQRRLDVGLGIIGNPELLFLDEPTTGLDPSGRRETWELIRRLAAGGHHGAADDALHGRGGGAGGPGGGACSARRSWPAARRRPSAGATSVR